MLFLFFKFATVSKLQCLNVDVPLILTSDLYKMATICFSVTCKLINWFEIK
jgi:hypothetical protein